MKLDQLLKKLRHAKGVTIKIVETEHDKIVRYLLSFRKFHLDATSMLGIH